MRNLKRVLWLAVSLGVTAALSAVWAEEIAVPVLWQDASAGKFQVSAMGFHLDDERIVYAIQLNGLAEMLEKPRFLVSLYSNTDGDLATGRTFEGGQTGWDLQANVNMAQRSMGVMQWNDRKNLGLGLYVDDYLVETAGEIIYVVMRREPLERFVFAGVVSLRVLISAEGMEPIRPEQLLDRGRPLGVMTPKLNFIRYGSLRPRQLMQPEALLIPRPDGLQVWNTYGERYGLDAPLPPVVGTAPALSMAAARGEAEAVHFAVTAAAPLSAMSVLPSELRGPGGQVLAADRLAVSHLGFVRNIREESFCDILWPEFRPQASRHHFVQVEVAVPADAVPGMYRGELALLVNGAAVAPIPLELEVFHFSMPERPFFKTAYCLKGGFIGNHYAGHKAADLKKEYDAQQELAKKYRFSPRLMRAGAKKSWDDATRTLTMEWADFDVQAKQYFEVDQFTVFQDSTFQLGSHGAFYGNFAKFFGRDIQVGDELFNAFFPQLIRQTHEHYRELGILDKTLFIIWDEPYSTVYDDINTACRLARSAVPEIQLGVFIDHAARELTGNIDVWLSGYATLAALRFNQETKDKRAWCYNGIGMGNMNIPASHLRQYYWLADKYAIEGYLYSEINAYTKPYVGQNPGVFYNIYANHVWMYPDTIGNPRPSLRMTLTREGLDDYDYMAIYRQVSGQTNLPEELQAAFPVLHPDGNVDFTVRTNRELQDARYRLAKAIEQAARR
ncbi:MAG: DUF4091 domain-containing protein [Lentisphaeria bacterium]|nr:DUF4091 domain-containing protein [Lentisphaeria bacterium]